MKNIFRSNLSIRPVIAIAGTPILIMDGTVITVTPVTKYDELALIESGDF
jgi:hypothetical protein